jgi:hypothetical protein
MPVARWGIDWTRRHATSGPAWLRIVVVSGAAFVALYYLVTGLFFDVACWLLKRFAPGRVGSRARIVLSIAFAVVAFGGLAASGASKSGALSSPDAVAAASAGSSSFSGRPSIGLNDGDPANPAESGSTAMPVASTQTSTPPPTAEPSPTQADEDDESTFTSAAGPGASFVPDETGAPAPPVSAADRLPGEPDPALTPGALNPDVTPATIGSTICVSGWTATIRPDGSYTSALKVEQMSEYGYSDTSTGDYEEDHLIPLELGGAPADPRNLWPEPYTAALADGRQTGAHVKDAFETELKREVCAGTMTLVTAQASMGDHWVHVYYDIVLPIVPVPTAGPTVASEKTPAAGPNPTPIAATTPAPTAPASLTVTLVDVPNPGYIGSSASVTASTSPGALCTIKVTLPSGHASTVKALGTSQTAGDGGGVSWTWTIASNTGPGTAKAAVTCALGGKSASAQKTFPMVN